MTYTKPEVAVLGDADRVIQNSGQTKPTIGSYDNTTKLNTVPFPAYDLDE
jgi:hypothetical protein